MTVDPIIRVEGLAEPISHFTDAVVAGGFVHVSGIVPVDAEGKLVGGDDVVAQTQDRTKQRPGVGPARQARRALALGFRAHGVEIDDRGADAILDAMQGVIVPAAC